MTTIIGIQGDGFCLISADSRISEVEGDKGLVSQFFSLKESNSKLALNGRYIVGAAGDLRAINILHHAFQPPAAPPAIRGKKLDHFVTVKFIPSLRECFEEQGYATPDKDEKKHMAEHASTVIMAVNGIIYVIDSDYSWISDTNGLFAIGSGSQFALGAMHALMPKGKITLATARKVALKAIATAARFDPYTGAPYQTIVQEVDKPIIPKNVK